VPEPDPLMKEESKKSRISQKVIHAKILYGNGRAIGFPNTDGQPRSHVVWLGVHNLEHLLRKKGSLLPVFPYKGNFVAEDWQPRF